MLGRAARPQTRTVRSALPRALILPYLYLWVVAGGHKYDDDTPDAPHHGTYEGHSQQSVSEEPNTLDGQAHDGRKEHDNLAHECCGGQVACGGDAAVGLHTEAEGHPSTHY